MTDASIEPPPPVVTEVLEAGYMHGVAMLDGGDRSVTLLDVSCAHILNWRRLPSCISCTPGPCAGAGSSRANGGLTRSKLVTFTVGGEESAAAVSDVQEIIRVPEINSAATGARVHRGSHLASQRPVADHELRERSALRRARSTREDNRIIVVNLAGASTGLLVDAVSQVLSPSKAAIRTHAARSGARQAEQLRGVATLTTASD